MAERNSKGQFVGLQFNFDSLTPRLQKLLPVVDAAVGLVFDRYEGVAETEMRQNARWTDRTANARNGLMAKHEDKPMVKHELILYHSMPYGFWLEVRWSGKFAIIGPTMFSIAPDLTRDLTIAVDYAVRRMNV
jgi:hypothetical protein